MLVNVIVSRGGAKIGSVDYRITDEVNFMGSVVKIDLPKNIRHELIRELTTNKSQNTLYGGQYPTQKIGNYVDGFWIVMHTLGKKFDFEFDDSALPVPLPPVGAIA